MDDKKKFKFPSLYELKKKRLDKKIQIHELNKQFYELDEEVRSYKKLAKQGKFSKRTIIFCISFIAVFAMLSLYIQCKTGTDVSSLLQIVATVFGGELLLLLFKRIFMSEDRKISAFIERFKNLRHKNDEYDYEYNNYDSYHNSYNTSYSNYNSYSNNGYNGNNYNNTADVDAMVNEFNSRIENGGIG